LADALARFEAAFTYPLGPGWTFRISHGNDYPRFYRAMGDAVCFVAENHGEVVGVLAAAIRTLVWPTGDIRPAVYLGDMKVAPAARGGRVLLRLAEAATVWAGGRADAGFAVVMGGTRVTPDRYTGRPGYRRSAKSPASPSYGSRSRGRATNPRTFRRPRVKPFSAG
jgi:hypothetical protein